MMSHQHFEHLGMAVVLYDGECPLCLKSVALLKRLDWLRRLRFENARTANALPALGPARLLEQMHLILPDGRRVRVGFEAFRWMAWRLPLLMPIAPGLYLPGVPAIGKRAYRWIARNRFRLVPCSEGECRVPFSRPSNEKQKN